jgi:hypothetical protein
MWPRAWRKNRLEGNRGTRGVYLFATDLITKGGLRLIGNVSQNILPTAGLSTYIICVQVRTGMRKKRLTPPFIDLGSFIKYMLIWTEG